MKNILNLISFMFLNLSFCQTEVPIENERITIKNQGEIYYYRDVNGVFNKFLGNWKYQDHPTSPTKIVEITFYKREMVQGSGWFNDEIFARIKYTENGVIIYNTFPEDIPYLMKRDHNIMGGYFKYPTNTNVLSIGYYSEPYLGGEKGTLKLIYNNSGGVETLNWEVRTFRSLENPFRMPYNMVLIKQP